jgi:hypothetical protein
MVKNRKPRGIKKDGTMSEDLCPYCYAFRCDGGNMSKKFEEKKNKRLAAGLCVACGNKPINGLCKCKSKL